MSAGEVDAQGERLRAALVRAQGAAPAARPPGETPDEGVVLSRSEARQDGAELRVSLHSYEGRPYLRVGLWSRDARGAWWPVKGRSVTVRRGEALGVVEGLAGGIDRMARDAGASTPSTSTSARSSAPNAPRLRGVP